MIVYEVPDLHELNLMADEAAVRSAINTANIIVNRRNPLLARVIMQMQVVFDDTPAPVSVSVARDVTLHVNTDYWWRVLTNQDLADLLIHEALHITQNHPVRFTPGKLVNLATDLAINQFDDLADSDVLSRMGITMDTIGDYATWFDDLAPKQSADYYLKTLQEPGAKSGESDEKSDGADESPNDDQDDAEAADGQTEATASHQDAAFNPDAEHQAWLESSGDAEQTITNVVQQAMTLSGDDGRGTVSGELLEKIAHRGKAFTLPTLTQGVQSFTRQQVRVDRRRSYSRYAVPRAENVVRRGRRYRQSTPVVVPVFVDASGSVSVETLADILASVTRFNEKKQTPVQFDIYFFDTQVYEGVAPDTAAGRGGTIMQIVFDWLAEQGRSMHQEVLLITDGFGEATIDDRGYRATWLITHTGEVSTTIPATHHVVRVQLPNEA
jgi:predicted metal-dependent peptidase